MDAIRALAAFCVVVNHVTETLFPLNADFIGQASAATKWLAFLGFTFGRTGVPLFFLLSGYLLLSRTYDETRIKRFYRHNFLPMLLVWEVWILLYSVFLALYNAQCSARGNTCGGRCSWKTQACPTHGICL